jgi:hypothetical protein
VWRRGWGGVIFGEAWCGCWGGAVGGMEGGGRVRVWSMFVFVLGAQAGLLFVFFFCLFGWSFIFSCS